MLRLPPAREEKRECSAKTEKIPFKFLMLHDNAISDSI